MTGHTVMASMAAAFFDFAIEEGVSGKAMLDASRLTEAELRDKDGRVSAGSYLAILQSAMAATGDSGMVMRHAAQLHMDQISIVGLLLDVAGPFESIIKQLNRYTRIIADYPLDGGADRFELIDAGHSYWLVDHIPNANVAPVAIEVTFASFMNSFLRALPDGSPVLEVQLSYPPPPHRSLYDQIFKVPIRFETGRNALRLDKTRLDRMPSPGNDYAFGLFLHHADDLLARLQTDETISARIEHQILPDLHKGSLSMDQVAHDLGMSRQTLYRRLKDEGLTFTDVHDTLRKKMACDYLAGQKISINEIAYLLGFSETSSFVRAFKRWTDKSPAAYRRSLTQQA